MARGKVTQWNGQIGFLADQVDSARVFFGHRALRGLSPQDIALGMELEFDRGQGDRGPRANNVRLVGAGVGNVGGNRPRGGSSAGSQAHGSRRDEYQSRVDIRSEVPTDWILPRDTQTLIRDVRIEDRHPCIQLDRLSLPGDQIKQHFALGQFTRTTGDRNCFSEVAGRRLAVLRSIMPQELWTQKTSGPLTLHLSRSNVLENAGLALHPIYGFAYLPGSGLKGMARAIASTELELSSEQIIEIFGSDVDNRKNENQRSGNVCFHDAWPVAWPKILVDIVNNHHPEYYAGNDAPGDWESPNPVYFLAVEANTEFSFFLSARRRNMPPELVQQAARCLQTALSDAGAGAKTAAGYGWFQAIGSTKLSPLSRSLSRNYALTLDSPAFLAGAARTAEDCQLRSATLRGQLRSWWRTLHAGCLSVDDLRILEAALWGDTKVGGAIRFAIEPTGKPTIDQYEHPQQRESGVRYLAYGMDDGPAASKQVRMVMNPGMNWELKVRIRAAKFNTQEISRERVAEQFEAALGLLTRFGGVGAKSRKGFGSLSVAGDLSTRTLEQWKKLSSELRDGLGNDSPFSTDNAETAALFDPQIQIIELNCNANSAFDVLEQAGRAYKAVARKFKHREEKVTLGLPRKIHGPKNTRLPHQVASQHQPPKWLRSPKGPSNKKLSDARHSAPIHLHLQKNSDGSWAIHIVLFPMKYLPSRNASIAFEREFTDTFQNEFKHITSNKVEHDRAQVGGSRPPAQRATTPQIEVEILEEKQLSGKIGFKVIEKGKRHGMLVDGDCPTTLPKVGDRVMVYWVSTSDANSPRYRWTPPVQSSPKKGNTRGSQRR